MNATAINIKPGIIHITPTPAMRTYGVIITFDDQKKMHFELEVMSIQPIDEGQYIFKIDRKQVYIDDKAPDLIVDKLADELGRYLYPMQLRVDMQGYVTDINNHRELVHNWDQNKYKTERYYTGPVAENIINNIDKKLRNKEKVVQALRQDWFMSVFFSGIYGLKAYDFKNRTKLLLPLKPFAAPVQYLITREITEQHTRNKCFIIECKGNIDEQRSEENVVSGNNNTHALIHQAAATPEGHVSLKYSLYHSDYSIRNIICKCSLTEGNNKKNVMVEIYHLDQNRNT